TQKKHRKEKNKNKSCEDMLQTAKREFWFIVGSQHLYGEETLKEVESQSVEIVNYLNEHANLPYPIVFKQLVTTADEITKVMKEVNYVDDVAGVITWMHTFSPAKMWINGTKLDRKSTRRVGKECRSGWQSEQ